jgi:Z1 domain
MIEANGKNLREALDAIRPSLAPAGRREASDNAAQIVSAIVKTYEAEVKSGEVGKNGAGPKGAVGKNDSSPTGLVYGRIQSGKTRAMITSTALAFDNQFRVVVVITTDNNRLVDQTHQDFQNGLPGSIRVYSKAHFKKEVDQAKQILSSGTGGIVLICSKGTTRLNQVIEFLGKTGAKDYPAVIFDDEGDQATLDTNTLKRSTKEPLIPPSKTHQLIHDPAIQSLRKALPRHVFVSVTGTPSGIVLQNADNKSRPSFVELLQAGKEYVGGDVFFSEPKPEKNRLITLIGENERIELLGAAGSELPDGLRSAIRFFLLAASAAAASSLNWPDDNKGYKLLCHPSVKTADQEKVAALVRKYLVDLTAAFSDGNHPMHKDLAKSYQSLKNQNSAIPGFDTLMETIKSNIAAREVLVLNKNTTGDELNYSKYFNFLIGGNTLGRGLAIKNLLVTYYVREAKVTQMDTMYQHARMFGYRNPTLKYTRVFLPPQLYERFRRIYVSDEELRSFIEEQKGSAASFPVRIAADIKATRRSVLDARKVDVLIPGRQIYPNYPFFKAPKSMIEKIRGNLEKLFPEYKTKGRTGEKISIEEAKELVAFIRTNGTNVWSDKKMPAILSYLGQQFKNGVILKFRKANRTAGDQNGLLSQGVLAGPDVLADASGDSPVLWIMEMTFADSNRPADWDGNPFMYPTLVLPKKAELVVFNKS